MRRWHLALATGRFDDRGRVMHGRFREVVRLRDGSLCRSGLVTFIARVRG